MDTHPGRAGTVARLDSLLEAAPRIGVGLGALLLIAVVALADVTLGPEFSFSLFYVVPIGAATWYGGRGWGFGLSVLAGLLWLGVELAAGRTFDGLWMPTWNATVRIGMFLVIAVLVHRLRKAFQRERELASVDSLTGLANSRTFQERLRQELDRADRYGDPFTLAYLDLDEFKVVNDRGGHAEGDRLLQVVAEALRAASRRTDVVARLGGDEFGVLLPRTSHNPAGSAIRKLLDHVRAVLEEEGWPVTASAGAISVAGAPLPEPNEAIQAADLLMYEMKDRERGGLLHLRWSEFRERSGRPDLAARIHQEGYPMDPSG